MFKIEDTYKIAKIPKTIRFTKDLLRELSDVSIKNGVSFNFLVLHCCKYALENLCDEQKP